MENNNAWGQLAVIDLFECDFDILKDEEKIKEYIKSLSERIDMKLFGEPLIKRFGKGELEGYSLMQFIETSSITVHLDEFGKRAFIDIFSCKQFDSKIAEEFSKSFFKAKESSSKIISRG